MTETVDIMRLRAELPALSGTVHLNTGGAGPMPQVAIDAISDAAAHDGRSTRMSDRGLHTMNARRDELRAALAGLLGARGDDLAIVPSVTFALNAVIHGINWQPGDRVITTTHEHPALLAPLKVIAERFGVTVDVIPLSQGHEPLQDACLRVGRPSTKLIALSHVSWITGATLDIDGAVRAAQQIGALTLVDGAQSVGAIPVTPDTLAVDAYALNAPKWTLGPQGLGALWVHQDPRDQIHPTFTGLGSTVIGHGHMSWHDEARRYELGALPEVLLPGWTAALGWVQTLGLPLITQLTGQIAEYARARLDSLGMDILTPPTASGIVTFRLPDGDTEAVVHRLEERGIVTRWVPQLDAVRISTAFFTTRDEIDALVDGLADLQA